MARNDPQVDPRRRARLGAPRVRETRTRPGGRELDIATWKAAGAEAARLLWEARTERLKLSDFAEEFFRRLAAALGHAMLFRKGDLHRLVRFVEPSSIPPEVGEKLDLLQALFDGAAPGDGLGSPHPATGAGMKRRSPAFCLSYIDVRYSRTS